MFLGFKAKENAPHGAPEAARCVPLAAVALQSDRRADQAIGKTNRGAHQGTGKSGKFAQHWLAVQS